MDFDFKTLGKPFEADWPVTISVAQDGGKAQEQTFQARFRLLPRLRLQEILAQPSPSDPNVPADQIGQFLTEATVSVGGLAGAENTTAIAEVLRWPHSTQALHRAYNEFSLGVAAKN
jgi:hypothetical protein